MRRALRILPLYWVAVLVFSWLDRSDHSMLAKAVPHMVFAGSFSESTLNMFPYSDVWWSLGTEAQFYLVLALSTVFLRTKAGRRLLLALTLLYLGIYFEMASRVLSPMLKYNLFGRGPSFLIGIGAAWIYDRFGAAAPNGEFRAGGVETSPS